MSLLNEAPHRVIEQNVIDLGKHFLSWYSANWHSGQLCSMGSGMTSAVKVKSGFKLARLDLDHRLADETSYLQKLHKLQIAMLELEEIYRVERRRGIIVLEGWDASGKSGAIQRLVERLDPRWVSVCDPTPGREARPALGKRVANRGADRGGAGPPLLVALLAEIAATQPDRDF
jgi:hypothetical protein